MELLGVGGKRQGHHLCWTEAGAASQSQGPGQGSAPSPLPVPHPKAADFCKVSFHETLPALPKHQPRPSGGRGLQDHRPWPEWGPSSGGPLKKARHFPPCKRSPGTGRRGRQHQLSPPDGPRPRRPVCFQLPPEPTWAESPQGRPQLSRWLWAASSLWLRALQPGPSGRGATQARELGGEAASLWLGGQVTSWGVPQRGAGEAGLGGTSQLGNTTCFPPLIPAILRATPEPLHI